MLRGFVVFLTALVAVTAAQAGDTPSPKDAKVYFIKPVNGAVVSNPVHVVMGLSGMGVAPAGVEKKKTGHHHLIINAPTPGSDYAIGKDDNHLHFGGGQTETKVELPQGKHTLQLVLGDWSHVPHDPPVTSEKITITVK